MTSIYEIKNIECKYPKSTLPVLKIEDLNIKENKIIFFIGASGVGKSTILETLGIMNNTICSNKESKFIFNTENKETSLLNIWQKGENALSKFRRQNLSFIFQQTNLFPHLTVHQNANIVQILQGANYLDANQKSKKIFEKLELKFGINKSPAVTNVSGGQRQRIAFARAISTNYKVLFADEPTGNLDWYNAENLMRILVNEIKTSKNTAVIVSHDITLAAEFADEIIIIEKKEDKDNNYFYGFIGKRQVYTKKMSEGLNVVWENSGADYTNDQLVQHLKQTIKNQSEMNQNKKTNLS